MNVIGFKLLNGEELLARCDGIVNDNKYTLERPLVIIPQKMGNQVSIGLVPWIISAGEEAIVEVRCDVVACKFTPITEISNEYLRQTTGIQLVTG